MSNASLKKLLAERQEQKSETGTSLTEFGLDQITNISKYLKERIYTWNSSLQDYDPLLEIAKLAFTTDKEELSFKCHQELAKYQYPQIRSLEVQSKADKEITFKIEMAGYAASQPVHGVTGGDGACLDRSGEDDIEDIETEGDIIPEESEKELPEKEKSELGTKDKRNYLERVFQESEKKGREL